MKSLLSVAVLALSAIMGSLAVDIPPPPLACSVVTPVKGDVWVMGKTATVTWACKSDIPLEKLTFKLLMAMELGTGTPDAFTYVDTIDNADELRRVSFPFILLTKYTPGDNYLVRIRSRNGGDPNPVTTEDDNKLQWSYSPNFKIVGPGGAANTTTGQVTTGGNSTTKNNTSSSTGGSSTGGSSSGGSSSGGSSSGSSSSGGNSTATGSSANNSTKPATGSSTNNAGIVNANLGVFFTTIVAAFVGAAFF